jgi:hypothetical protein
MIFGFWFLLSNVNRPNQKNLLQQMLQGHSSQLRPACQQVRFVLTVASRRHLTSLPPVWMSTSVDLDRAESMQANKDMFNGVVGGRAGKRCRGRPLYDYLAMFVILFASGLGLDPWRYPCSPAISCL